MDARQQRFTATLASACEGSKLTAVHDHPTSGAPISRVITKEHKRGQEAETMLWPYPDEEPAVKTVILTEDTVTKREAICWAREREAKVGAGFWMSWTEGSRSDYGRVVSRCSVQARRPLESLPQPPGHRTNGGL
jgi:hypothetical protein